MTLVPVKKESLIEKRNVLNEMRANNMSLQELRFFSIYLSKINARAVNTRLVRFSLLEFQKIMELQRVQMKDIKPVIDGLLCKVVHLRSDDGGFTAFQLFKRCRVYKEKDDTWQIEIDAHDDALPLMFEFKKLYFTYQLWNALRLKSKNQLRMYEILKQYEYIGVRTISLVELRALLGMEPYEYPRWDRFRERVLESCQKELADKTDIKFTYEPIRKGRKGIVEVRFIIEKNKGYVDQLTLEEYISLQDETKLDDEYEKEAAYDEHLKFIAGACEYEFDNAEMQVLFNIVQAIGENQLERYRLLKSRYDTMNMYAAKGGVKNRFSYYKKIIKLEVNERIK